MELFMVEDLFSEGVIPPELKGYMNETCPECAAPILTNLELTYRRCVNGLCPAHMSQRADRMFKYLGIKGIGPETSKKYIYQHKVKSHLDLIPHVLNFKPSIHLFEIALLLQLDGERSVLEEELKQYSSFENYFMQSNTYPPLRGYKDILIRASTYFEIKPPLPSNKYEIMITGNLRGYSKAVFVALCNEMVNGKVHIKQVGVKNSANACITENKSSSSQKAQLARGELRHNVSMPLYTPEEFLYILSLTSLTQEELDSKMAELEEDA